MSAQAGGPSKTILLTKKECPGRDVLRGLPLTYWPGRSLCVGGIIFGAPFPAPAPHTHKLHAQALKTFHSGGQLAAVVWPVDPAMGQRVNGANISYDIKICLFDLLISAPSINFCRIKKS